MSKALRNEIIDSFIDNICYSIVLDYDLELSDDVQMQVIQYLNEFGIDERKAILSNVDEEYVTDTVCCGCAEYWRQEHGIDYLEDELDGDEFDIAMNYICKKVNVPAIEYWD